MSFVGVILCIWGALLPEVAVNFREPKWDSIVVRPVCILDEKSGFLETWSGGAF